MAEAPPYLLSQIEEMQRQFAAARLEAEGAAAEAAATAANAATLEQLLQEAKVGFVILPYFQQFRTHCHLSTRIVFKGLMLTL